MRTLFLIILAQCWSAASVADEVRIAAASNFTLPARLISTQFEQQSGHRVILSTASSGKLYAQIINGAPYDLLLSADARIPEKLEQQGIGSAGQRFTYARGRLVLYRSRQDIDLSDPATVLASDNWHRLAIANPRTAPYGAAAWQVLKALGLEAKLGSRLVRGENITQAWQFVASGNAELGFVSWSQVIGSDKRDYWLIPETYYQPLIQQAIPLRQAERRPAVRAMIDYLQSDAVRTMLADRFGYGVSQP